MYQELEMWKMEKAQIKYAKAIDELTTKEMSKKEFDKQLDKLAKEFNENKV